MSLRLEADVGKTESKHINTCRQYLSDITNALGTSLDPEYLTHRAHESRIKWIHYEKPPQKVWNTWRKIIQKLVCTTNRSYDLKEK